MISADILSDTAIDFGITAAVGLLGWAFGSLDAFVNTPHFRSHRLSFVAGCISVGEVQ